MKGCMRLLALALCLLMLSGCGAGKAALQAEQSVKGVEPNSTAGLSADSLLESLKGFGYSDPIFKWADVADTQGEELLCLCRHEGAWRLIVIGFADNQPVPIYTLDLRDQACYIVELGQVPHLCLYSQKADSSGGSYDYRIFRFDGQQNMVDVDSKRIEYSQSGADPVKLAAFFEAFSGYVSQLKVLRDPFGITGTYWIDRNQVDFGSLPQEEESVQQTQEKAGFVSIQYADSWLHLRTGPGTQYDKVLLDPNDPQSFVRQAKGAPVTVLETVETGDGKNPVWVKIRITYADRELIGYSSKRYITVYGE